MGHNWIVDVIVDLRTFAERNALPNLASELERVASIAVAELALEEDIAKGRGWGEDTETGQILSQA